VIAGPIALALALFTHPPCVPDPTVPPRPTNVNCTQSRVGEPHGGYLCTRSDSMIDGHNHVVFDWLFVATPKPPADACDAPAEVCSHNNGWTCRCKATGPDAYGRPCDWQLTERTELR
jgi:hypothetical protein